jgi:hypothetical protein
MKSQLYIRGYDNGTSGGSADSADLIHWEVRRVTKVRRGTHWLLDVLPNLAYLDSLLLKAGGPGNVVIAYEQTRKNKRFGTRNNYVSGRNEEFWRVLLTGRNVTFASVDPLSWQNVCFKDIPPGDSKDRAREYVRRRCPECAWLDSYAKAPREAFVDAMCIALWCHDRYLELTANGIAAGYHEFSGSAWWFPTAVAAPRNLDQPLNCSRAPSSQLRDGAEVL